MLTALALALVTQLGPGPIPFTLNVTTNSPYRNGTITWDGTSKWVGCLTMQFQYQPFPDGRPRICGTASGTAAVRVELDNRGIVTLRWNASQGGLCAVNGTCNDPTSFRNVAGCRLISATPYRSVVDYNVLAGNLPPFWGSTTMTIAAP